MSILYKVCKRTIERGNAPADMPLRVNVFYGAGLITTDEYDELMNLLADTEGGANA